MPFTIRMIFLSELSDDIAGPGVVNDELDLSLLSRIGLDYSIARSERNESHQPRVLIPVQRLSTVLDGVSFPWELLLLPRLLVRKTTVTFLSYLPKHSFQIWQTWTIVI